MTGLELICLALNIYYEARSEPPYGQLAVGQVVMQRVESPRHPDSVCEVVYQGGEALWKCHFSWYCDSKSDIPRDKQAWQDALYMAEIVANGARIEALEGVLHYHSNEIQPPWWTASMTHISTIGNHEFWKST